jgi:heme/copper-type cytochrome/quinol oxidase subunit 2
MEGASRQSTSRQGNWVIAALSSAPAEDRRLSQRKVQWLAGGATIALVLAALLAPLPVVGAPPQERRITISAHTFAFDPGTVRANRGDTVVISLESTDVVHGIYLDGYGVSARAEPGRPGELRFVAYRSGAFRFRCNVACGNLHPFMIGKLVVGPNLIWLRAIAATLIILVGAMVVFWKR